MSTQEFSWSDQQDWEGSQERDNVVVDGNTFELGEKIPDEVIYLLDGRDINGTDGQTFSAWSPHRFGDGDATVDSVTYNATGVNDIPGGDGDVSAEAHATLPRELDSLGSQRLSSAIGVVFSTTSSSGIVSGVQPGGNNDEYSIWIESGYSLTAGRPGIVVGDDSNNSPDNFSVELDTDVTDGDDYFVGFDVDGPSGSDVTGYLNGSPSPTTVQNSGTLETTPPDFAEEIALWAWNDAGTIGRFFPGTISGWFVADAPLGDAGWQDMADYFGF